MARLQYRILTNPEVAADGYQDVLVYVREWTDPKTVGPWSLVVQKRSWVDPVARTHGRRLKALLRSLA